MLTDTLPAATNQVKADISELSPAVNGYPAGGQTVTVTSSTETGGTYKLIGNNVVFTASGGSFGPFRYAVLYNNTQSNPVKPLIGWWDYGAEVTVTSGNTFTVDLSNVSQVYLTLI